jgi:hypothetical protein
MDQLTEKTFRYILDLLLDSRKQLVESEIEKRQSIISGEISIRTCDSLETAIKFIDRYILDETK